MLLLFQEPKPNFISPAVSSFGSMLLLSLLLNEPELPVIPGEVITSSVVKPRNLDVDAKSP